MGKYEDLLERARDEIDADLLRELESFSGSTLRTKAEKADALEKELAAAKAENEALKAAPKRVSALQKAGVDVASLSLAESEIVASQRLAEGAEYDEEWAKGLVERYKLPVRQSNEEESGEEAPNAAEFGKPSGPLGTGGGQGAVAKSTLTLAIVAGWGPKTRMRFAAWCDDKKSDALERLSMGETVTGVTFDPGAGKA